MQFYRATETVVKAQTWIVRSVDALIAIVKTRLQLAPSLCGLLLARSLGHDERRKSSRRQTTKVHELQPAAVRSIRRACFW
jgi:hypothetical protein